MLIDQWLGNTVRILGGRYMTLEKTTLTELPVQKDTAAPLMLYIHIPFCEELCTYCSFHRVPFQA